MNRVTTIVTGLAAFSSALLFDSANAQSLSAASWNEHVFLQVELYFKDTAGMDPAQPEAVADSLSVVSWGASGSLAFGPPGPPKFTSHAYGKRTGLESPAMSFSPAAYDTIAQSQGIVTFQFMVRTVTTPPVAVAQVPVVIGAQGATYLRGTHYSNLCYPSICLDGDPAAFAQILITDAYMTILNRTITSAGPTPNDRTLNLSETHQISPDIAMNGSIQVLSLIRMKFFHPGQWAEATATIVPSFQISADLIPGTDAKYSDYFQIEYSPGYWALGNPTPVNTTTWGKIKSLYSKP